MAEEFTHDEQLTRSYAEAVELDARAAERFGETAEEAFTVEPCDVWREIRPDVVAASNLKFIPSNIRRLLRIVVILLDQLCKD